MNRRALLRWYWTVQRAEIAPGDDHLVETVDGLLMRAFALEAA